MLLTQEEVSVQKHPVVASTLFHQEIPKQQSSQQVGNLRDSAGEWDKFLQQPQQEHKSFNSTPRDSSARQTPSLTDSCRSVRGGRNVRGSIDMGEALGVPGLLKARHVGYDSLQVGTLLGRGSFGKVYKGVAPALAVVMLQGRTHACAALLRRP